MRYDYLFAKIMQIERNGNELARLHSQDAAYLIRKPPM